MSFKLFGELIDICLEEERGPREIVIIREERSTYREVYPIMSKEYFDDNKCKKAIKAFEANRAVDLDDLLLCLKEMSFDSGRQDLVNALRGLIKRMSYFERQEIADTFVFESSVPCFLND